VEYEPVGDAIVHDAAAIRSHHGAAAPRHASSARWSGRSRSLLDALRARSHKQLRMASVGIKSTGHPIASSDGCHMSEVARHQLLITLVHGTWPRGFFPTHRRQNRHPLWFEENSPFLARLSAELGDIPHKIKPLLWSGANSIFVRDKTAQVLTEYLSAEHAEHPQDDQLIIAHSHGGNIALRALHHLQKHDASQTHEAGRANPLVVTLATPFIEIHHADFGNRPGFVRWAVVLATMYLIRFLAIMAFPSAQSDIPMAGLLELSPTNELILAVVALLPIFLMGWYWIQKRAAARQNHVEALSDVTRLGEAVTSQRLLVIRAIDDEASLLLAFGAILNYIIARSIMCIYWIIITLPISVSVVWIAFVLARGSPANQSQSWYVDATGLLCSALIITLLGVLAVSRLVYGRELAVSPMECQINTQSVPDAVDLSQIVTLVSHKYVRALRHGIYEHDYCAKAISDWVRSRLVAH
jgi:hypothetical protein